MLSLYFEDKLVYFKETILVIFFPQAFGFPMLICHIDGKPEMFFGSDRFELMANCIGEKHRKYCTYVKSSLT